MPARPFSDVATWRLWLLVDTDSHARICHRWVLEKWLEIAFVYRITSTVTPADRFCSGRGLSFPIYTRGREFILTFVPGHDDHVGRDCDRRRLSPVQYVLPPGYQSAGGQYLVVCLLLPYFYIIPAPA